MHFPSDLMAWKELGGYFASIVMELIDVLIISEIGGTGHYVLPGWGGR